MDYVILFILGFITGVCIANDKVRGSIVECWKEIFGNKTKDSNEAQ